MPVCRPIRTRTRAPSGHGSSASRRFTSAANAAASGARSNSRKNASPWVSTCSPACRSPTSRTISWWRASRAAHRSPRRASSRVDPSMSVKTSVHVRVVDAAGSEVTRPKHAATWLSPPGVGPPTPRGRPRPERRAAPPAGARRVRRRARRRRLQHAAQPAARACCSSSREKRRCAPDAEPLHPAAPERLVGVARADEGGQAGRERGGRRAGSAVVHGGAAAREDGVVRERAHDADVVVRSRRPCDSSRR